MALWKPDDRGFFEKHAGKLLIFAFAGWPLNAIGIWTGATWISVVAGIWFLGFLSCAIGGYIARGEAIEKLKGCAWGILGLVVFVVAVLAVIIVIGILVGSSAEEKDSELKSTDSLAPSAISPLATSASPPANIWRQLERNQDRLAEMYAFYDAMVARMSDECALPDSVFDQAENDSGVLRKLALQTEAQQALVAAQLSVQDIDPENPGKEGYALIIELQLAWDSYFRATRELLKTEGAIYETHGCTMPAFPDWLTDL